MYFPVFVLRGCGKRFPPQPQTICSEFPSFEGRIAHLLFPGGEAYIQNAGLIIAQLQYHIVHAGDLVFHIGETDKGRPSLQKKQEKLVFLRHIARASRAWAEIDTPLPRPVAAPVFTNGL